MRMIFWQAVEENRNFFGNTYALVYDDSRCFFTTEQLELHNGEINLSVTVGQRVRIIFCQLGCVLSSLIACFKNHYPL